MKRVLILETRFLGSASMIVQYPDMDDPVFLTVGSRNICTRQEDSSQLLRVVHHMATAPRIATTASLLASVNVPHVPSVDERRLSDWLALDRLSLLAELKTHGIGLAQRQTIANGLAKAKREGRVDEPTGPQATLSPPAPAQETVRETPQITRVTLAPQQHCRVFAISDIHCDHPSNMAWLKASLPKRVPGAFDVCLCAGDVSDRESVLAEALALLKVRFDEVVFTAGNHEV